MNVLFILITVLQAASAMAALFMVFKPGVPERTRRTAVVVVGAVNLLAAVTHLSSGHVILGTVFAALAVLTLIIWSPVLRVLARWIRARRGDTSTN